MPYYFEDVFFLQDEQAEPWIQAIDRHGEQKVLRQILDLYWYPGEHDTRQQNPAGPYDKKRRLHLDPINSKDNNYVAHLSYNENLQYLGVVVEVFFLTPIDTLKEFRLNIEMCSAFFYWSL